MYVVCVPQFTHRGQLFPPQPHPQVWQQVMHEAARKRIKDFIMTELEVRAEDVQNLRELVHKNVQNEYPELRLQDFGTVCSDGFRLPQHKRPLKVPTLEENVTTLQSMGLADRTRALQVLEVSANDLDSAVNFLLAFHNFD
jgi:hypothetical protein